MSVSRSIGITIETIGEYPLQSGPKIIPFPVTRPVETEAPPPPGDFQAELEDFLRELGYIE